MKNGYRIEDNRVVHTNPFCPRCGKGVFMADRGEWWACGKCGDRYAKDPSLANGSSSAPLSKDSNSGVE